MEIEENPLPKTTKSTDQSIPVMNDDVMTLLQAHEHKSKRNRGSDSDSDDSIEEIKKPNTALDAPSLSLTRSAILGKIFVPEF